MITRAAVPFLALLFSVGCATKAIAPEPDEPRPTATPPTPTAPPPFPGPAPDDERADAKVGRPCGPNDTQVCGTKGRIASGVVQNDQPTPSQRLKAPCELPPIDPKAPPSFDDHARGCVKDDRLYVQGACMECRIFSEWMMVAIVEEMTDPQLAEAQLRVRLPKEPLLRTASAWTKALASRKR